MIDAEFRGKLGQEDNKAHSRSEDLLTSTVFGLLRYLPAKRGICEALRRSQKYCAVKKNIVENGGNVWPELDRVSHFDVEFWPHFGPYGEPDLLLWLRDDTMADVAVVVIEAKLYAPKSSRASEDDVAEAEGLGSDQLVKYWYGAKQYKKTEGRPLFEVYLTAHSGPPLEDLEESQRGAPEMHLRWMAWQDIWFVLRDYEGPSLEKAVAYDLVRLLEHKGLRGFAGFRGKSVATSLGSSRFWEKPKWFSQTQRGMRENGRFWRHNDQR
jgi:hypothetical protein